MHNLDMNQSFDFRLFIRSRVKRMRDGRVGTYSALAKHVNWQQSQLSAVLQGRRQMPPEIGVRVAGFLGLSALETEYFLEMIYLSQTNEPLLCEIHSRRLRSLQNSLYAATLASAVRSLG